MVTLCVKYSDSAPPFVCEYLATTPLSILLKQVNDIHRGRVDCLNSCETVLGNVAKFHDPALNNDASGRISKILEKLRGESVVDMEVISQARTEIAASGCVNIEQLAECKSADLSIWWAGKQLVSKPGKTTLGDYLGGNEKTKVTVWLRSSDGGPPLRQVGVNAETYQQMLEFYHKRQAELKFLAQDDDDGYLDSVWTDPQALKKGLSGTTEVQFRY